MKIGIANDHRGFEHNKKIANILEELGYEVINYGPKELDNEDDYPDFAFKVGEAIKNKEIDRGILICRTGIGISIACNKVKGIRCARVCSKEDAELSRIDNNANVITLSYELGENEIKEIIEAFLETEFSDHPRHARRVSKIDNYDN